MAYTVSISMRQRDLEDIEYIVQACGLDEESISKRIRLCIQKAKAHTKMIENTNIEKFKAEHVA